MSPSQFNLLWVRTLFISNWT